MLKGQNWGSTVGFFDNNYASPKNRQTILTLEENLGMLDLDYTQKGNYRHRELVIAEQL